MRDRRNPLDRTNYLFDFPRFCSGDPAAALTRGFYVVLPLVSAARLRASGANLFGVAAPNVAQRGVWLGVGEGALNWKVVIVPT